MDTTQISSTIFDSGWTIYLIAFLVLLALYFVQKYAYLIDRKLNKLANNSASWEGSSWPLILGLTLGILTLLYNVFSPNDMQSNPVFWSWSEWLLLGCCCIGLIKLTIESVTHFGWKTGLVRLFILSLLSIGFFYAGLLAGLLISSLLAIGVLIYFFRNWRKIMLIK